MTNKITTAYESIDLCACFDILHFPPEDFMEECRIYWLNHNPFHGTIERRIGNTWFTIESECAGSEPLADKVKRLIFSEKGAICSWFSKAVGAANRHSGNQFLPAGKRYAGISGGIWS